MFTVIEINEDEAQMISEALGQNGYQFLIAYDSVDEAIKVKVNNGSWSPPFGNARADLSH